MRLNALALVILAAGAASAAGQDTASTSLQLPVHGRPSADVVSVAVPMQRPADVVARLARQALNAPGDEGSWKALAGALPELALSGGADFEGTFEAARLADSLSAAQAVGKGLVEARADAPSTWIWALGTLADWAQSLSSNRDLRRLALRPEAAGSLLVLLLAAILVWRVRRRRKARSARRTAPPARPKGRVWTARALARGGVHVSEIAERTGMAQEAVDLALRLAGVGAVQSWNDPLPHRERAHPRRTAAEVQLEREYLAGSNGLRDRRVTYAGAGR